MPRLLTIVMVALSLISVGQNAVADARTQAKRIFDRLTGTPPSEVVLDDMVTAMGTDPTGRAAAEIALQDPAFYNVTLKNWAAPWTNEQRTVFADLNDYIATVIGLVRDEEDFRQVLYGDIIYIGVASGLPAYSNSNNAHYVALERLVAEDGYNLSDPAVLEGVAQSEIPIIGLTQDETAGVMTTRANAVAFYERGTNRSMFASLLSNHLCHEQEEIKDNSRVPDWVRQDAARSPGGDSRIFLNDCVGCHAGMDAMLGGFAYYDLAFDGDPDSDPDTFHNSAHLMDPGEVAQNLANEVNHKYLINANNFPQGFRTTDDSWVNYWRQGPNSLLGWNDPPGTQFDPDIGPDAAGHRVSIGNGIKSLGMEFAYSDAFASCQVKKAFKAVCLRDPDDYAADRNEVDSISADFMSSYGFNMKNVFRDVAAYCKGD